MFTIEEELLALLIAAMCLIAIFGWMYFYWNPPKPLFVIYREGILELFSRKQPHEKEQHPKS